MIMTEIRTSMNLRKSDEGNGFLALADILAREARGGASAKHLRPALVLYRPLRVIVEDEREIVQIEIVRAEPILEKDMEEAKRFIERSAGERRGEDQLPLDFHNDIEAAFGGASFDKPPADEEGPGEDGEGGAPERPADRRRREVGEMFRDRGEDDQEGER
jgi:hypothetical protein